MSNLKSTFDQIASATKTQILDKRNAKMLKGGVSDPPPWGNISDPPPWGN